MELNYDPGEVARAVHEEKSEEQTLLALPQECLAVPPASSSRFSRPSLKRRRLLRMMSVLLLILLISAIVRLSAIWSSVNDQLLVHINNQGVSLLDLRQGLPISPYLLGANVFPEIGTNSVDHISTGFMSYMPPVSGSLRSTRIKLLRFPGGGWGEEHLLSLDQINAFSAFLSQTGADGMIQAHLLGSRNSKIPGLRTLAERANLAGSWVDYVNNPHSAQRVGKYAHAPFHPVKLWTVGNAPDLLRNPDTGKPFTVAEYTNDFIQYSIAMHQNDPTIQVFGPELSQFYGVGVAPTDASGQLWMDGFLKGVGAYERSHPELKFHLLDGVSFHLYPLGNASKASMLLLSSSSEWDFLLPPLRQLIRQDLGRDVPVGITEINTNPNDHVPTPGLAALWWANTLGTLMNQETALVAFSSVEGVDAPYPLLMRDGLRQTPMFRVMQVFSNLQHNLIPAGIEHYPVSFYATQDDEHQTVGLLFVNASPNIQLAQVSAQSQFLGISPWQDQSITLSGYSITLLTLHRGGGAGVYSYDVPSGNGSATDSVNYTVCGKATDLLANNTPC